MAASFFQPRGLVWVTLGLSLAVTDLAKSVEVTHTRFVAARRGATVHFRCFGYPETNWFKETKNGKQEMLDSNSRIIMTRNNSLMMMYIKKIDKTDNGLYFCKRNISCSNATVQNLCCGTELRVMGVSTFEQVQDRHRLKDTIIFIQTILLVFLLSMPLFLTRGKGDDSKDATREDHTYEGLAVELVDTYEDIGTYQDKGVKWDLGEHPGEE